MAAPGSPASTAGAEMAQLELAMAQFLSADNAVRKPAEERLKVFLRRPTAAGGLLEAISASAFPEARQMAALFLRKKINAYWIKLSEAQRTAVKQCVLARLVAEPQRIIRRAVIGVTAALAKHLLPHNQWPELAKFIFDCVNNKENAAFRELGMLLLHDVLETAGRSLEAAYGTFSGMFAVTLVDADPRVRVASLRALAKIMTLLSNNEHVLAFQKHVPAMLLIIQQCVDSADDDVVSTTLDGLADAAESEVPVLVPYTKPLFDFLLKLLLHEEIEIGVKDCAAQVVVNMITKRPKAMTKAGVIPQILSTALQLATRYDEEEHAELRGFAMATFATGDGTNKSSTGVAEYVLDKLAQAVPNKHVLPALMTSVAPALSHATWQVRRAALVALAMVAEGCREPMQQNLGTLLPLLAPRLKDEHPICRSAACWCLGQWSQWLKPAILDFHAQILPAVFGVLSDSSLEVQNTACYVLECFCENLQPELIVKYLTPLMGKLGSLITSTNIQVKEMAISALCSTAMGAGAKFTPFFEATMTVLLPFMTLTDDEHMSVRARATDCVGRVANAVGLDVFEKHLEKALSYAVQGLALDNTEVTEYTYLFMSQMAVLLKEDIEPVLQGHFVDILLDTLRSNDGMAWEDDDDHMNAMVAGLADDDSEEGDDDSEDGVGRHIRVRTSELNVKSAAALTLGVLAQHAPKAFGAYIADTSNLLLERTKYFHEELRQSCWTALGHMVTAATVMVPPTPPAAGQTLPTLHPDVQNMIDLIMHDLLNSMQIDDDRESVARCCECVMEWVKHIGIVAVVKHMTRLTEVIVKLLKERTVCQRYEEEYEDEDDEGEHDHVLMDAVADLIGGLAKAAGPSFETYFRPMVEPLLKFCRGSRPASDRAMAAGVFAEVAEEIGAAIAPHLPAVWPAILAGMGAPEMQLQRNAAYACGHLLSRAGAASTPYLVPGTAALLALLRNTDLEPVVTDNAAAALARVMSAHHATVPLPELLPHVVNALPLKEDHEEDRAVYGGLIALLAGRKPAALTLVPQITSKFAMALAPGSAVAPETQARIVACLKSLASQFAEQMATVVAALPVELKTALTAAVSRA